MFLIKSKTKIDRKRESKSCYSVKLSEQKNRSRTISGIKKKDILSSYLLKESASLLEQANRSYGGLKLGVFVTKRALFVQFQRIPFGKHLYGGPALSAGFSCVTNQNPSPSYSF